MGTQCKAAVASVSGVSVSKVSCMSNASSASSASGATRRLQAVMDVEISYDDQSEAVDAVSTPQADMMAGLITALAADSTVSAAVVSYTRMPCSEGGVCGTGFHLLANAETLGCAATACTAADTDLCCTRLVTSDARSMTVLNSCLLLLSWIFL